MTVTKKVKLRPLSMLLPYILRYRCLGLGALIALVNAAGVMLALPVVLRKMFDQGFANTNSTMINAWFTALLLLGLLLGLSSAMRYYCIISMGERIIHDLRRDVFAHLVTLSAAFYDKNHSGELASRLASDTTQIKSAVGAAVSIALRNLIMMLGSATMMVLTSPKLSILVLSAIPLVLVPLLMMGRKVRSISRLAQDTLANANALASEQIANIRNVQAFNAQNFIIRRFYLLCEEAMNATHRSISIRAWLTGLSIVLVFGCVVTVLWAGMRDVLTGQMSSGTLGQFVLYAVFAVSSFGQLSEVAGTLAQTAGAAERLSEILTLEPSISTPPAPVQMAKEQKPQPVKDAIRFDNVSFSYPARREFMPSLQNLSFTVKPGETIALVGASGAGKSTIFSLLLRFYDPLAGQILVENIALPDMDPRHLRAQLAYVPQEPAIFSGSIRDNIIFGLEKDDHITRTRLEETIHAAQLQDFITDLPQGLDTQLGERGQTLSGGQKQRIAIARALLRDCPILLLDEATSALDAQSERFIQTALDGLMQERTTLIIAHRLATVLKANRIIVLDKGKIIEEGTHQTLMEKNGLYTTLAKLQFLAPQMKESLPSETFPVLTP